MERQVNSNVNGSVKPSKRNSHDDDDIDITEDSGVEIRNAEQPEQQQQQAHEVEDVPSCPVSDSMPPLAASLLSSCSSGNNIDIWEPYPLNPPQSFDEEKLRFEALQAYLELAIQSNHLEGTEVNANEESTNSANNVNNQDTTESHIASTGDESGNNREMQGKSIADILSVDYTKLPRIRDYQEQVWEKHYMDLVEYHQREGHCCVPHLYQENPGLARWVKRQRYQYKLRLQGVSKSTMVPHRVQALEKLGFVWDSHAALWEEQLNELRAFRMLYGHCNVPSVFPANPQLSTWVKRQRRLYRERSMPNHRLEKLVAVGFDWKTR